MVDNDSLGVGSLMNWNNLRFFLSVVQQGTVVAAAKDLSVTHSTVIRRISQLEDELGCKLFNRMQSGYTLTTIGKTVYEKTLKVEESIHDLALGAKEEPLLTGPLTISVPDAGVFNLTPFLKPFVDAHPEIQLKIMSSMDTSNLNRMEADIALRLVRSPEALLIGKQLGEITFNAYASRAYLEQLNSRSQPHVYDWVFWIDESRKKANKQVHRVNEHNINFSTAFQSSSPSQVLSAIKSGIGVGFLADNIANEDTNLIKVDFPNQENLSFNAPFWLLYHRDRKGDKKIQAFRKQVGEVLADTLNSLA